MFALVVIAALALYFMNTDERSRLVRWVVVRLRLAQDGAQSLRVIMHEPLQDTLRQRTPWAVVTPVLVAINIAVFAMMLMGPHPISDPDTLVAYGGNFGPRTTNGEWGRLITAVFVHRSVFDLFINVAALISVGLLLERLVGHLTFLAVYLGAGALASVVSLSTSLTEVSAGASAAVFGLYGLLLASWAHGTVQHATTTVRLAAVRRIAPIAMVFVAYSLLTDHIDQAAESTGVVSGFVAGLVLGRYVCDGRPPARKVGITMATAAMMVMIAAIPLRGVADVRPVLAQVLAVEEHTASEYRFGGQGLYQGANECKGVGGPDRREGHARARRHSETARVPAERSAGTSCARGSRRNLPADAEGKLAPARDRVALRQVRAIARRRTGGARLARRAVHGPPRRLI